MGLRNPPSTKNLTLKALGQRIAVLDYQIQHLDEH